MKSTSIPTCSDDSDCPDAGTKLKARSAWTLVGFTPEGTDDYGFSALPGGYYFLGNFGEIFGEPIEIGNWWSATTYSSDEAYARAMGNGHNEVKWSYDMKIFFFSVRCLKTPTFTDTRDNKTYKYVKIGTQTWMAENLNYNATGSKCYAEGVPGVSADSIAKNCTKYGRLYDWSTAMALDASYNYDSYSAAAKHQGICPSGWHLPSDAEWNILMKHANPGCADNDNCAGAGTQVESY